MNTRALVGAYQKANSLKVDCWPSETVLTHMRGNAVQGPEPAKASDSDYREAEVGLAYNSLARAARCVMCCRCCGDCVCGAGRSASRRGRHRRTRAGSSTRCGRPRTRAASRARCSIASRPTSCSIPRSSSSPPASPSITSRPAPTSPTSLRPSASRSAGRWPPSTPRCWPPSNPPTASIATSCSPSGASRAPTARPWARAAWCARWRRWPSPTQRRAPFWRNELIAALRILQDGQTAPETFVGSWAGATGHTQFIPSAYAAHAVDFDKDGRRDIWGTVADALASTANYLRTSGWSANAPWGFEVILPPEFDHAWSAPGRSQALSQWLAMGVRIPASPGNAHLGLPLQLVLPAGAQGPAFLVTRNFRAILRYNNAQAYALAVGHLADRIAGGAPLAAAWPSADKPLARGEREELQRLLAARGHRYGRLRRHHGRPDARRHPLDAAHPQSGPGRPSELRPAAAVARRCGGPNRLILPLSCEERETAAWCLPRLVARCSEAQ